MKLCVSECITLHFFPNMSWSQIHVVRAHSLWSSLCTSRTCLTMHITHVFVISGKIFCALSIALVGQNCDNSRCYSRSLQTKNNCIYWNVLPACNCALFNCVFINHVAYLCIANCRARVATWLWSLENCFARNSCMLPCNEFALFDVSACRYILKHSENFYCETFANVCQVFCGAFCAFATYWMQYKSQ